MDTALDARVAAAPPLTPHAYPAPPPLPDYTKEPPFTIPMQIAVGVIGVMGRIRKITKSGWNAEGKYAYATLSDVNAAVQDALVDEQLMITQHEVERVIVAKILIIKYRFDIFHESGVGYRGIGTHSGACRFEFKSGSTDDKAISKAYSSGYKYFVMNLFKIPITDLDDDDPDADDRRDSRRDTRREEPRDERRDDRGQARSERRNDEPRYDEPRGNRHEEHRPSYGASSTGGPSTGDGHIDRPLPSEGGARQADTGRGYQSAPPAADRYGAPPDNRWGDDGGRSHERVPSGDARERVPSGDARERVPSGDARERVPFNAGPIDGPPQNPGDARHRALVTAFADAIRNAHDLQDARAIWKSESALVTAMSEPTYLHVLEIYRDVWREPPPQG